MRTTKPNLKTGDGELFKVPKVKFVDAAGNAVPKGTPGANKGETFSKKWYVRLRGPKGWKKYP